MAMFDVGQVAGNALQIGQGIQQAKRQNSLADLYKTQGEGIAAGDPAALNSLAQIDPMAAYDIRRQSAADTRATESHQLGMQYDQARLDELKLQGARAAETHAANMSEIERKNEAESIGRALTSAALAYRQGPEAFSGYVQQNAQALQESGIDPASVTYDNFLPLAAGLRGAQEALVGGMAIADAAATPRTGAATASMQTLQQRAAAAGLQPGTPEYQQFMLQGGSDKAGTNVTVNLPDTTSGTGDFYKELDKKSAATFSALSQAGTEIPTKLAMIDQLDSLFNQAETPQGMEAAIKSFAGNYGIQTEGLDNIQAINAIISQLVPQQRPPGSGTMSDADLALFKQSLPRLINSPGGNQIIINTIRGIAQYQASQAQIADAVMNRDITPEAGRQALRELQNPIEGIRRPGDATIGGLIDADTQSLIDRYAD